ncbi:NERD domain-containing protein/DEAD/DEAH box helicase [Actinoplanes sp. KI2]|uniref:nuclease-related domain-containing DEAD/DEAH box helicase n=1 Tax=Actinoplanes sp. KI2 TaxID=2983315 RepID=UPI0021D5837E|nr:nuclease-related domain-containing protein [Actinoplanes sp. KI2]MCU7730919.1 NERD domain-containing protein/DEAD/DEAH box helicase [Actinoplanes sp. KI2]
MRMIPRELPPDLDTTAELRVHAALASPDLAGVALHSLLLPEHDYKLTAEIDFLLVLDEAVLVVEVKGGGVACRQGQWTYSDRAGHRRTSREGPFHQANSAMYALRRNLEQRLAPHALADVPFGYLVITPDVELPMSAEWDEQTYVGRGPFSRPNGLRDGLRRAVDYWVGKHPGAKPLPRSLRTDIANTARPDFDRSPGLHARASALDQSFDRLTAEQFDRLDIVTDNARVLCAGGAGTGKTFLAVDVARRRRMSGADVIFTCRSEVLAAFVARRLHGSGVRVVPFERLAQVAPAEYLVVDEAQDLMSLERLDVLDKAVVNGLWKGHWVMFHDPNGQAHVYEGYDPEALQMLRDTGATTANLRTNCRNTREIAFQTRALTGADTGVAAAGSGPEVVFVTCENQRDETARLEAHLRDLREHDVPNGDITILSLRGDWDSSSARDTREARRGGIRRLGVDWAADWPGTTLTWASVVDIKGLENRFICVVDVDGLRDDRLDRLYVGLSRARAGLWVALDEPADERVKELYSVYAEAAFEVLRKGDR